MGEFGAVVQPFVLAMLDAGDPFLASRFVAFKLVGDDNPRDGAQALEAFAEETLGGLLITPRLNQDVQAQSRPDPLRARGKNVGR